MRRILGNLLYFPLKYSLKSDLILVVVVLRFKWCRSDDSATKTKTN